MQTKVYDFNLEKVKGRLKHALRKNRDGVTTADLETLTGLPKYQVEQGIKNLINECRGQLKATESGNTSWAARVTASTAAPMEPPGGRLNDSVTEGT